MSEKFPKIRLCQLSVYKDHDLDHDRKVTGWLRWPVNQGCLQIAATTLEKPRKKSFQCTDRFRYGLVIVGII